MRLITELPDEEREQMLRDSQQQRSDVIARLRGSMIFLYHLGKSPHKGFGCSVTGEMCELYAGVRPSDRELLNEYQIIEGITPDLRVSETLVARMKRHGSTFRVYDFDSNQWKRL